jgi:hypothetical protein
MHTYREMFKLWQDKLQPFSSGHTRVSEWDDEKGGSDILHLGKVFYLINVSL